MATAVDQGLGRRVGEGGRPVRVAQLVTTMARGGAQLTVLESCRVDRDRVDMTVLAGSDRPAEGDFWADQRLAGVRVVEVPSLKRRIAPLHDALALFWLIRWLRRERPDVVHTHSTKAGVIGRMAAAAARVPVVHTVHGWAGPLYAGRPLVRSLVALLERLLAHMSNRLVVVGHGDRDLGLRLGIGSADRYRVIRSGVDLPADDGWSERRRKARLEFGVTDTAVVIGMVSRLAPQKDHRTALAGLSCLSGRVDGPVLLVLVGDGPSRGEIEAEIARRGLSDRVRLLGHRGDAAELAAGFDIGLLTSHWEGLPRSLVEAAAAGVPLVATDVGSVSDLVVDGVTGYLVAEHDADTACRRMCDLIADPGLRRRLGAEAAKRARGFSADRMRSDLVNLWSEAADL